MSRSKWKVPFIHKSLLEKSLKLKTNKKIKLKTWSRQSSIVQSNRNFCSRKNFRPSSSIPTTTGTTRLKSRSSTGTPRTSGILLGDNFIYATSLAYLIVHVTDWTLKLVPCTFFLSIYIYVS